MIWVKVPSLGGSYSDASASGLGMDQAVNPGAEASGRLPRKRGTLTGTPDSGGWRQVFRDGTRLCGGRLPAASVLSRK